MVRGGTELTPGHSATISGATGNAEETTTILNRRSLDGRTIRHVDADTLPNRPDGVRIAGIAGVDLFMGRLAVLDTGCESMSLLPLSTDPVRIAGRGAVLIRAGAIKNGKQLTLPVTVNGVTGVATLDTGANSTLMNNTFAKNAGVNTASGAFRDGSPVRGADQKSITPRIGPIGTVRFAGVTRPDVVARIADLPVFDDDGYTDGRALNIGLNVLGGLRLTIDYSARKFWVAPSRCAIAHRHAA